MGLITDVIDPQELSGFVRAIDPRTYGFTLDQYLPNRDRQQVEYAFNRVDTARPDVAGYRPMDVEADIATRRGFARVSGAIPPISKKILLGEELILRLEEMRRGLGGRNGATPELVNQVFDDAALLTEMVLGRIELARGQALSTGIVDMIAADRGFVDISVDYTIGGTVPVTPLTAPSPLWTTHASATPIANLIAWMTEYRTANGGADPASILTSNTVLTNMLLAVEVKSLLTSGGIAPPVVTEAQLQGLLSSLGLPPIVRYDTSVSVAGSTTRCIAENLVLFLPAPSDRSFGETTFGPTAESIRLAGQGFGTAATAPGLTAVLMDEFDPVATWTKVAGLVVPVIKDPKKIGKVAVIA